MAKHIVWTDQAKADVRGIEQPIAIQILKTLGRYVLTGEGATKQLKGVTPPMIRLRAQNHRVFFREQDDSLKIERVLDRKEAYR
ncbi:type II toxin-antitoxin system RelE family toxin [Bryobacter aggregatus]|uniref:type II toxin-antitoxin system RelE family toxin n=1 Tax=Bryobacter aggregatus TaxID=360054 RepID=UPI0004E2034B|nr:type II toxin-antitoxin system RelE/ParE family toxin [Bryobacter aggregatus]